MSDYDDWVKPYDRQRAAYVAAWLKALPRITASMKAAAEAARRFQTRMAEIEERYVNGSKERAGRQGT